MNPFLAQIVMFGGNFAPRGWALCDGQTLPINSNQALFALLGTTYGGDGRTTFALPDLRGRSPISQGTGPGLSTIKLGQRGGKQEIGLTIQNLPNHFHNAGTMKGSIMANEDDGQSNDPNGKNFGLIDPDDTLIFNGTANTVSMAPNSVGISGNTGASGNQQPFNSRNPFLGINYIIAMQGSFPSRN
jgi:microcystin-dependent protein